MLETQSRAKATIDQHRINKTKVGFVAQEIDSIAFEFKSGTSNSILTITQDGDVIWNGKPSEAADIMVRSFQMRVEDEKGVTKAAKRRYYALACRNILKQAEQMEYEEFLAFLNREVYNRDRKVILDGLKNQSS